MTAGGIYGSIRDIKNNVVSLQVADNVRINVDINSIYQSAQDAAESETAVKQ